MRAWLLVCDQWRIAPMGGVLGLDWPGVRTLLDAHGDALDPALVTALRTIERAAVEELRAAADRRSA